MALHSPSVFSSPQLSERAVSRYVSDMASPFCLPSEHTAARMEMRKSSTWREPWYGCVTGAEPVYEQSTVFQTRSPHPFCSTWREEKSSRIPSQMSDVPTFDGMYSYRAYASSITAVGATSVAPMAAPVGESPIQKISGRQGADDWLDDNPADPNKSNESPVGEPMVLLLFVLALAVYRYQKDNNYNLVKHNRSKA
ncbi:MAG: hypothetical protein ACI30J_02500 [Paludibacteraceae bacterium]